MGMGRAEWVALGVAVSLASLLVSGLIAGTVLARLPEDYFLGTARPPTASWAGRILKNLAGVLLAVLGIVLSLPGVPGQGFLTVLAGLILIDFPGKYRFERGLVRRGPVRAVVAALRSRSGRPPFRFPE
jgi:hypothetical protein